MRLDLFAAAAITIVPTAAPALAHDDNAAAAISEERPAPYMPYEDTVPYGYDSSAREAWLADCRRRLSAGYAGAGGVSVDRREGWPRGRDECETYLDDYYRRYARDGYYQPRGHGAEYGYPVPAVSYSYPAAECCMAGPMTMMPVAKPQCTETVEYVYEDVPFRPAPARRYIPRRSKVVPDKRVRVR
ncbi:MAG TPA: hypothetical protein VJQ77_07875 [Novosphingobium sp.]|nr:hypothetical protein [Novosphingobium sp.]